MSHNQTERQCHGSSRPQRWQSNRSRSALYMRLSFPKLQFSNLLQLCVMGLQNGPSETPALNPKINKYYKPDDLKPQLCTFNPQRSTLGPLTHTILPFGVTKCLPSGQSTVSLILKITKSAKPNTRCRTGFWFIKHKPWWELIRDSRPTALPHSRALWALVRVNAIFNLTQMTQALASSI